MQFLATAMTGLALAAAATAQSPLTTTFAGGNGQAGNIFDLVAVNGAGVTVKYFDVNVDPGVWDFEVYALTNTGPYLPSVTTPTDWTLVGSITSVASNGTNVPTTLPICVDTFIPNGVTQAFYVTVTNGTAINYTNGTTTGALFSSNPDLEFYEGAGMSYPFGSNFNPRVFNGNIHYDVGNTVGSGCQFIVTPTMVGVSESTPFSGTLNDSGGTFVDGDFLRWNYNDAFTSYPGALAVSVFNYGVGGPPPIGVTTQIAGLVQVNGASTPIGFAEIGGPGAVGDPDAFVQIPTGLFAVGDTVRIQGLVLDLNSTNLLPVTATPNTVLFTKVPTCLFLESFEAVATGTGNYPTGWSNGGGIREWAANTGGTTSGTTGPSSGNLGAVYMYCETSTPAAAGDTFIMNTSSYSLAGATTVGFDLSRIGATIGTLEVRMDDGTGTYPTLLATYTGPEPSAIEWTVETIPLPVGAPANASFQFSYTRGTSFTGDIAIDNFCIN